jgi:hypothetical protein
MQAVSRIIAIAQNLSMKKLKNVNCQVFSSLALAFSRLVASLNDPEPLVAQKALSFVHTLTDTALRLLVHCLQLQFDCVLADRVHVLNTLALLYRSVASWHLAKAHRTLLTWDFFAQRFGALCLEQQLAREPAMSPADVCGAGEQGGAGQQQRKVNMARLALKRSGVVRSISGALVDEQRHATRDGKFSYNVTVIMFDP